MSTLAAQTIICSSHLTIFNCACTRVPWAGSPHPCRPSARDAGGAAPPGSGSRARQWQSNWCRAPVAVLPAPRHRCAPRRRSPPSPFAKQVLCGLFQKTYCIKFEVPFSTPIRNQILRLKPATAACMPQRISERWALNVRLLKVRLRGERKRQAGRQGGREAGRQRGNGRLAHDLG